MFSTNYDNVKNHKMSETRVSVSTRIEVANSF